MGAIYVLVVVCWGWFGTVSAVSFQEFSSQERCEKVASVLRGGPITAYCAQK